MPDAGASLKYLKKKVIQKGVNGMKTLNKRILSFRKILRRLQAI